MVWIVLELLDERCDVNDGMTMRMKKEKKNATRVYRKSPSVLVKPGDCSGTVQLSTLALNPS